MFFFSSRSRHTIGALVTGVHTCALPICEGMSAPVLNSRIAPGSDGFRANAAHNRALRAELHARVAQAGLGGPEKNRERHIARGKLLPRERVERLLAAGSHLVRKSAASGTSVSERVYLCGPRSIKKK